MAKVTRLDPAKPRRMGETVFTGSGLRLAPQAIRRKAPWFAAAIAVLPLGAFCLVFFW